MNSPISPLSIEQGATGIPILPIKRVRIMNDKEFEALVEAWVETLKGRYVDVARFGSAGDRGVDVAGFVDKHGFEGNWDGYQCKHYAHPLHPGDAYPEIGKLIWHIACGNYIAPRLYAFVASQDIGTTLSQLLRHPSKLKDAVAKNWDNAIAQQITKTGPVALDGDVKRVFEQLDWTIFKHQKIQNLLDDLRGTPYFLATFGGGLPKRPEPGPTPDDIRPNEIVYADKLRRAYSSHCGQEIPDLAAIGRHRSFLRHFDRQRRAFYHAEGLREFSKDTVPPGTFEALQEDVRAGVEITADADHASPLVRVNEVVKHATLLPLTSNPLVSVTTSADRHGVCHQLANDGKLDWETDGDA
jgi:hypothetical protein